MNHVYVTKTLDGAVWAAEMAPGEGPGRIYIVEPEGALEDDPNVTDKKLPGNPTHSYRSREPVKIVGEITDWVGHSRRTASSVPRWLGRPQTPGTCRHLRLASGDRSAWRCRV